MFEFLTYVFQILKKKITFYGFMWADDVADDGGNWSLDMIIKDYGSGFSDALNVIFTCWKEKIDMFVKMLLTLGMECKWSVLK